mmetsp:Transcript_99751/g.253634  ORF Transcript_99751/g.253634 Transcript_99751/m.253634 type:complete len:214 (-) Transcript_99751:753-1394(-)
MESVFRRSPWRAVVALLMLSGQTCDSIVLTVATMPSPNSSKNIEITKTWITIVWGDLALPPVRIGNVSNCMLTNIKLLASAAHTCTAVATRSGLRRACACSSLAFRMRASTASSSPSPSDPPTPSAPCALGKTARNFLEERLHTLTNQSCDSSICVEPLSRTKASITSSTIIKSDITTTWFELDTSCMQLPATAVLPIGNTISKNRFSSLAIW